jgi:hypothetical protein
MSEVNAADCGARVFLCRECVRCLSFRLEQVESEAGKIADDLMGEVERLQIEADSARAVCEMAVEGAAQREEDAEVRGARWGLQVALDPSKWPVSKWTPEEVCRDARERGEG